MPQAGTAGNPACISPLRGIGKPQDAKNAAPLRQPMHRGKNDKKCGKGLQHASAHSTGMPQTAALTVRKPAGLYASSAPPRTDPETEWAECRKCARQV